jgi:hypothetical protein
MCRFSLCWTWINNISFKHHGKFITSTFCHSDFMDSGSNIGSYISKTASSATTLTSRSVRLYKRPNLPSWIRESPLLIMLVDQGVLPMAIWRSSRWGWFCTLLLYLKRNSEYLCDYNREFHDNSRFHGSTLKKSYLLNRRDRASVTVYPDGLGVRRGASTSGFSSPAYPVHLASVFLPLSPSLAIKLKFLYRFRSLSRFPTGSLIFISGQFRNELWRYWQSHGAARIVA